MKLAWIKFCILSIALLTLTLSMGTALAEGNFTSYIERGYVGFSSHSWTDNNTDGTHTRIRFDGCRDLGNSHIHPVIEVQLTRERSFLPDQNMGRKTLNCYVSDTEDWGDVPAGKYHFTITSISSGSNHRVNVHRVTVTY